jgi:hypothetical protein
LEKQLSDLKLENDLFEQKLELKDPPPTLTSDPKRTGRKKWTDQLVIFS